MTHDGPDNTVLPSPTWLGAFVRVRNEEGDEWHAAVVGARVGVRSRTLRKVVLRWGAGEARRDYRRRVLRVEACDDGKGARCVLVVGGEW